MSSDIQAQHSTELQLKRKQESMILPTGTSSMEGKSGVIFHGLRRDVLWNKRTKELIQTLI